MQLALLPSPLPTSVQLVWSNEPAASVEENAALPAGTLGLAPVSVTVAVHAVDPATGNAAGTQLTVVVVDSAGGAPTIRITFPELGEKRVLPPNEAVTVAAPGVLGVYATEQLELEPSPIPTSVHVDAGLKAPEPSADDEKATNPVGDEGAASVSTTVAVHCVDVFAGGDDGEHATVVVVVSAAAW